MTGEAVLARLLTFELEADAAPPTLAALLGDVSGGAIECDAGQTIAGYAAHGADMRGAIEPLVTSFGLELFDDGAIIRSAEGPSALTLSEPALGCSADAGRAARVERKHGAAEGLPSVLTLNYYDPARDYQSGQMRASAGANGRRQVQIDFPAVIQADSAKALAQSALARHWARREQLTLRLSPEHLDLVPGDVVRLPLSAQRWSVERVTVEQMVVVAELRRLWREAAAVAADAGRVVGNYDEVAPPTAIALFDLPDLALVRTPSPVLQLAAASGARDWRPVPIEVSINGILTAGQTATGETVMGTVTTAPATGQAALVDDLASLEVELVGDAMWLLNCDDDALGDGVNLAVAGNDLIQFGRAEPTGPRRFKLSRLLRGRRGTEWAMDGHAAGESFAMIDADALQPIEVALASLGAAVSVQARGLGDGTTGAIASRVAGGEALRPPSPVHLTANRRSDGSLDLRWVRRSRSSWAWLDSVEAPIGESAELYHVRLAGAAASIEFERATPQASLTAAEVAALGAGGATFTVSQIGEFAASHEASLTILLN